MLDWKDNSSYNGDQCMTVAHARTHTRTHS